MNSSAFEQAAKASIDLYHDLNLGTYMVATAVDTFLCGVMIVQFFDYWNYSRDDRRFNQIMVLITTTSSLAATIYITHMMFKLFVYDFGHYAPFGATMDVMWMCIFDIIPSTATQIFFAHRAYNLNGKSKTLLISMIITILASVIGSIATPLTQKQDSNNVWSSNETIGTAFTYLGLSGALAADIIITGSIMWGLSKSRTGWMETDKMITKLIRIGIETQLPPTLLLIAFFVVIFGFPDTYLNVFPLWVQSKIYTCGLLASLNSRYALRSARSHGNMSSSTSKTPAKTVVHVLTETYVHRDDEIYSPSHTQNPTVQSSVNRDEVSPHRRSVK
ncbi:uncharacterized protein L201_006583 [Kwoniella dendrophila CBS 6074]|uniref:DUF6534 domain-containing protein n=1 Tax=Kwoniella dendrophila CBS 6074 TaxID=1295534 RepID=A0AAX4K249_9TREE